MKKLTKILKYFLTIAVILVLPIVVFTFITAKTTLMGIESFVVLSGSMTPTLPVGSVIYTRQQTSYSKGDIIAFKSGDVNITHRIVKVNSDGTFTTKGDANNAQDSKTVASSNILGKNIFYLPYLGRVIVFLKTPIGFFATVFFPISVFVILEIWNLKSEIEKEAEKKFKKRMEQSRNLNLSGASETI